MLWQIWDRVLRPTLAFLVLVWIVGSLVYGLFSGGSMLEWGPDPGR